MYTDLDALSDSEIASIDHLRDCVYMRIHSDNHLCICILILKTQ